jgi:hypothetical protein
MITRGKRTLDLHRTFGYPASRSWGESKPPLPPLEPQRNRGGQKFRPRGGACNRGARGDKGISEAKRAAPSVTLSVP